MRYIQPETISTLRMLPYYFLMFMTNGFDQSATNLALPMLYRELGFDVALSYWFSTIGIITKAAFTIPLANLGVFLGLKTAICCGLVGLAACDLALLFAGSFPWILVIKFVSGAAYCMTVQCNQAMIQNLLPDEKRKDFSRIQGLVMALIGAIGPTMAALIIDAFGWRWNFVVIAVFSAIRIIFVICCFERVSIKKNKFDFLGSIFLILALSSLCLSFTVLADHKFLIFAFLLMIAFLFLVIFAAIEKLVESPLISRDQLYAPVPEMASIIALIISIMASENIVIPQFFTHLFGGVEYLGYVNSTKMVLVFCGMLVAQQLLQHNKVTPINTLIIAAILSLIVFLIQTAITFNIWAFSVFYILRTFVSSPIQLTLKPLTMLMVEKQKVHKITSFTSTLQTVTSCIGHAVISMILQMSNERLFPDDSDYWKNVAICFGVLSGVMMVVFVLIMRLVRNYRAKVNAMEANGGKTAESQELLPQ